MFIGHLRWQGEGGGEFDAGANAHVGAAAAQIAGHGAVNIFVRRLGIVFKQGGCGHDLAGLTVTALGDIEL